MTFLLLANNNWCNTHTHTQRIESTHAIAHTMAGRKSRREWATVRVSRRFKNFVLAVYFQLFSFFFTSWALSFKLNAKLEHLMEFSPPFHDKMNRKNCLGSCFGGWFIQERNNSCVRVFILFLLEPTFSSFLLENCVRPWLMPLLFSTLRRAEWHHCGGIWRWDHSDGERRPSLTATAPRTRLPVLFFPVSACAVVHLASLYSLFYLFFVLLLISAFSSKIEGIFSFYQTGCTRTHAGLSVKSRRVFSSRGNRAFYNLCATWNM